VTEEELGRVEARIKKMNPLARIHRTEKAVLPIDRVLRIGGFDLQRALDLEPGFLDEADEEHDHHEHEHADHEHDHEITSVGIRSPGEVDEKKLSDWLGNLLRTKGQDIFRMKGVLAVKGRSQRVVFQGVHMLMDGGSGRPWGTDPRESSLIFIGRHLDRQALNEGFRSCLD
jgi:G3E family GTPase